MSGSSEATQALAASVLRSQFRSLGDVTLVRFDHGDRASNAHFRVTSARGAWILKSIEHADALFGVGGAERVRSTTRATLELFQAGFPVEEPIATDTGDVVVDAGGLIFRLYRWINGTPYAGSSHELELVAQFLHQLHTEALAVLSADAVTALSALAAPYPLELTIGRLREVHQHLTHRGILVPLEMMEAAALTRAPSPKKHCFVHMDLHPDNVLFSSAQVHALDFDQARVGDPSRCIALAIARSGMPLDATLGVWATSYPGLDRHQVLAAIVQLELEKILRITLRAVESGTYVRFLERVQTRHLPSLASALELLQCVG